jgi:hypothetical protein
MVGVIRDKNIILSYFGNPQMDGCLHRAVEDDVCTECGYTQDRGNLVSYFTGNMPSRSSNSKIKWAYHIKDKEAERLARIKEILFLLNKQEYALEVEGVLKTKKFKSKLGLVDKIIATSFYILKRDAHPVIINDFCRFSKRGAYFLLRTIFREFPYLKNTDEYTDALFYRFVETFRREGLPLEDLNGRLKIVHENIGVCTTVVEIILYSIFHDADITESFKKYRLGRYISLVVLKNTKKKIEGSMQERVSKEMSKRVDKALLKISSKGGGFDKKIELIDVYIEQMLLAGTDAEKVKRLSLKIVKTGIESFYKGNCHN